MILIPDINVLLYAVDSRSPFHIECATWLGGAMRGDTAIGFTWQTIAGFVRLGTNAKVTIRPLTISEAFRYLDDWLAQAPSCILHPSAEHLVIFRGLIARSGAVGNLISDAHLAAFAADHDGEIVSCDADFGRFPEVRWFNPVTGLRKNQ
jgi:toxin-antitoxin system PIN domain toxin